MSERKSYVCVEGEWIDMDIVEFLNVEEDISGRDLITFNYNDKTYSSFVINK
jgi:hypothetical protein